MALHMRYVIIELNPCRLSEVAYSISSTTLLSDWIAWHRSRVFWYTERKNRGVRSVRLLYSCSFLGDGDGDGLVPEHSDVSSGVSAV
jgi:hypothetical protein